MRIDALDDNAAKKWSSGELGKVLARNATKGLAETQPQPQTQIQTQPAAALPEPEEEITPYISLDQELMSGELTERGVRELASGFRNNYGTNTYFHELAEQNGHSEESEDKKKKKNFQMNEMLRTGLASFTINGIEMTEDEAFENLELANKRLSKEQKANFEKSVVDVSEEELKTYSKTDDSCLIVDGRPIEDISIIDGQIVETEVYYEMMIENSELEQQQESIQQFTVQLESGDVTWDQVPEDIAVLITEEHEIQENGPQEPEVQQPTILEQLTNLEAEMQQIQTVKPSVSYSSPSGP